MSLVRAVRGMISRAIVRGVDEARKLRALKIEVYKDDVRDGVEHVEPYGYTARPLADGECIVVHVAGDRSHPIAISTPDRRHRPTDLAAGEVAIYDDQGQTVRIYRDRVEVSAAKIVIDSGTVEIGDGTLEAAVLGDTLKTWLDTHTHTGVTPGSGASGVPAAVSPAGAYSGKVKVS